MNFNSVDLDNLKKAKVLLENPGLAAKITNLLGKPIEEGFNRLPEKWSSNINKITRTTLTTVAETAIFTMEDTPFDDKSNILHKFAVAVTGGVGGFFGLPALAIELPISTTIMLRSIADVARSEGESINNLDSKLACIEVFALGGPSKSDDATESGYYAVRVALARSVSKATEYIAEKGIVGKSAPPLARLIIKIAERFSIQITEKTAAQAVPAIGAVGGALINTLFIDHFQNMAHGHFIVRRLERKYGKEPVKNVYLTI